jgi:MFS family permease
MQKTGAEHRIGRVLFYLTLIWGIAIFWIAPRPPLVDFPQHAGQVALWHDLLTGTSPWSKIFLINLYTPYLIGYGLALPLSFIMPVGTALKLILSVAYAAFVLLGSRLRAQFDADPRLDWFFFPTFFGFAYTWGFYTFLASTPVVILFLLVADRYARQFSLKRGLAVTLVGLVLLMSHGLAFVFGAIVAGVLYTVRCRATGAAWMKRWLQGIWAFVVPAVACLAMYVVSTKIQSAYWAQYHLPVSWNISIMRLPRLLINATGDYYNPRILLGILGIILFFTPWMLGLRLNRRNPAAWVMLVILGIIEFFVPSTMISTGYVYERFALFAFPAYALVFVASSFGSGAAASAAAAAPKVVRAHARGMFVLMACVWGILGFHSMEMHRFAQESADFEPVLAAMQPGQRVLALPYVSRSDGAGLDLAYRHYATWYQSEKQGLVDFNFGWFPPQVVRFRTDHLPLIKETFRPEAFTVEKFPIDPYRYIIARDTAPLPADLFKGADCEPRLVMKSGSWTLFERKDCPIAARDLPVHG